MSERTSSPHIYVSVIDPRDLELAYWINEKPEWKGNDSTWAGRWNRTYFLRELNDVETVVGPMDYVILLVSSNDSSFRHAERFNQILSNVQRRGATLIPVVEDSSNVPDYLQSIQHFDLHENFNSQSRNVIDAIVGAPNIDFAQLVPQRFELLVRNLLQELGFERIVEHFSDANRRFDFSAEFRRTDPFGTSELENWIVEVKYYKKERVDLRTIQHMSDYLKSSPWGTKGLIVTNSQPTSVVRDWSNSRSTLDRVNLRIIDGGELKRILLAHPAVVEQYFAAE